MTKLESIIEDLTKAATKLEEATSLESTVINQDATIQRFEFTFELAWKAMQEVARETDETAYGPRNTIREAGKTGLIDSVEDWLKFLSARNLTVHTYNESTAQEVYQSAKQFVPAVKELLVKLKAYTV